MEGGTPREGNWDLNKCGNTDNNGTDSASIQYDENRNFGSGSVANGGFGSGLAGNGDIGLRSFGNNEYIRVLDFAALDAADGDDIFPDLDEQRPQTSQGPRNSVGPSSELSAKTPNLRSSYANLDNVGVSDASSPNSGLYVDVNSGNVDVSFAISHGIGMRAVVNPGNIEVSVANSPKLGVSDIDLDNLGTPVVNSDDGGMHGEETLQGSAVGRASLGILGEDIGSSGDDTYRRSSRQFDPLGISDRLLQEISVLEDHSAQSEFELIPQSMAVGATHNDDNMLLDAGPAFQHSGEDESASCSLSDMQVLSAEVPTTSLSAIPRINVTDDAQFKRAKLLTSCSTHYFTTSVLSDIVCPTSLPATELVLSQNFSNKGFSEFAFPTLQSGNDERREPMVSVSVGDDDGYKSRMCNKEDHDVRMDLTDDLLHMVFSFLDQSNLCIAAVVCKQWRAASTHEDFWKSLNFQNRKITREQVVKICRRYPNAMELNVLGAPFVDEIVAREALYSLRNLEVLILGQRPLSDRFFSGLVDCPLLDRLSISDAPLGSGSQEIHLRHDSLRYLQITRCRVMRISIRCAQLETLSLRRTGMASAMLTCPQLHELDVASCHKLSDAGVRIAATSCPSLTSLDMSNCSYVSDETLREIAAACSNLHVLDASYCPNISLEAVRMPLLTNMKLQSCDGINASSMASLSHCSMLEALQLDMCSSLTSVTLNLPCLQNISLVNCRKFVELNLRCPVLSSINVSNCPMLNRIDIMSSALQKLVLQKQHSLKAISLQCLWLSEVDLTECESLTNSVCRVFSENGGCPMLSTLILDGCESLTTVHLKSTSLTTLSLGGCRAMTMLELKCPSLQQVSLDGCDRLEEASFCPVGLRSLNLGICPRLRRLEIEALRMTSLELKGCGVLSQASIICPQLLSLDASFCRGLQDDFLFATTTSCPMIESLILMSCRSIRTEGLFALKLLPNLMLLDLSYTFLTNLQPVFETCSRLKILMLQACKCLVDTSLDALHRGEALPELCELDLSYSSLCQFAIEKLLAWCPHLTRVSLNGCENLYDLDWGLERGKLYKGAGNDNVTRAHEGHTEIHQLENTAYWMEEKSIQDCLLENLNCVGCKNIRKVAISEYFCVQLSSLNLSLSNNLKEVDLGCRNLTSLNLSNCSALEILKLECPRLTNLLLQACGIGEQEVQFAIKNCNSLETLDIRLCPKISSIAVMNLRMMSPGLKRLFSSLSV